MLLHLSSISQELEWKEKQGRLSFTTFPPSNRENSLFYMPIFPKSLDYFQKMTVFFFLGNGIHRILHIQNALRELTRKLENHMLFSQNKHPEIGLHGHEEKQK